MPKTNDFIMRKMQLPDENNTSLLNSMTADWVGDNTN